MYRGMLSPAIVDNSRKVIIEKSYLQQVFHRIQRSNLLIRLEMVKGTSKRILHFAHEGRIGIN